MAAFEGSKIDPHVKILDEEVLQRAKSAGLDAIVYAPHFTRLPTIRERAAQYSDDDLRVLPGRELFTGHWSDRAHVLALGLDAPVPDFLTLEATMAELQRQDAAVLAPHPDFLTVSLDPVDLEAYATVVDAVEVYNPKHRRWHNRRAAKVRSRSGHPAFASSYAHLRRTVGEAWVTFEEQLDSIGAVSEAFKRGTPRAVGHERGLRHEYTCALEFAHLAWENSIQKFDRVVLEGTEPTHPTRDAYAERFEEKSVC